MSFIYFFVSNWTFPRPIPFDPILVKCGDTYGCVSVSENRLSGEGCELFHQEDTVDDEEWSIEVNLGGVRLVDFSSLNRRTNTCISTEQPSYS